MDEISATNVDKSLPNDVETQCPTNETNATTRLSPSIEDTSPTISGSPVVNDESNIENAEKTDATNPDSGMETEKLPGEQNPVESVISAQEEPPDDPGELPLNATEPATELVIKAPCESPLSPLPSSPCEPDREQIQNDNVRVADNDNVEDGTQNQDLIDDSDDLLVPTDYVPDSEDVIGDESKRKYSQDDDFANDDEGMCKKFKHDVLGDEESMQTEDTEDDINEMNVEMADTTVAQSSEKPATVNDNVELAENCDTAADDLITDMLSKGISPKKTVALDDIIDDFIETEQKSEIDNCDSVGSEHGKTARDSDCETAKETSDKVDGEEEATGTIDEKVDFDISEKLKDMGEISLAPVSKADRKPLPDFDLGDEVSLEQICKKGADGDDKRNKVTNLRKNIREVMDDKQLDASTLAAQREELERLARVQEQQRMIREMQRQVALDRQNSKTQNKVLSLLTGHTSLLKSSNAASSSKPAPTSTTGSVEEIEEILSGNLTPSVSIAPIKSANQIQRKPEPIDITETLKDEMPAETDDDSESGGKLAKSADDLLIIDADASEEDDGSSSIDDDDCIELKPKKDIVTIDDSSDDDCIM